MGGTPVKCQAILGVLDRLRSRLGAGAFVINDHWEADLLAVGIASPRDPEVLVYISCFRERPGRFYVELERPGPPGGEHPWIERSSAGVPFDELAVIVAEHLSPA